VCFLLGAIYCRDPRLSRIRRKIRIFNAPVFQRPVFQRPAPCGPFASGKSGPTLAGSLDGLGGFGASLRVV